MVIIFILVFLLLSIIIYISCFQKESYESPELIHILTRTGTRETCFKRLKKSLKLQKYAQYRHIISNDNKENRYLEKETCVVPVEKEKKYFDWMCPYETYLNELCKMVDGWIIFLDDDAKFIDSKFLHKLGKLCKKTSKEKVIIFRIFFGKEKNIRPATSSLKIGLDLFRENKRNWIDMASICIHSSLLRKYPFTKLCGGDMLLIKRLEKDGVPIIIDKKLPIGIWANSDGSAKGKDIVCLDT
jgi:hypothetical protein